MQDNISTLVTVKWFSLRGRHRNVSIFLLQVLSVLSNTEMKMYFFNKHTNVYYKIIFRVFKYNFIFD